MFILQTRTKCKGVTPWIWVLKILEYLKLLTEATETTGVEFCKWNEWSHARSKMKLFAKVINSLKTANHKVHKENASIVSIEIITIFLLVF